MALKITGVKQTIKKLRNAAARHEIKVTEAYRNFVWTVFEDVVRHTPQWSGNLASNWRLEVGHGAQGFGGYLQRPGYGENLGRGLKSAHSVPYYAGHPAAVSESLSEAQAALSAIRWNSVIHVVNYAPYGEDVEAGRGPNWRKLRDVNKFSGANVPAHGVAMVQYAITKYSKFTYRNAAYGGILKANNKAFV